MLIAHIGIFLAVFFVILGVVNQVPAIYAAYRERYEARNRQTARELDKFFINIKPTKILIGSAVIGVALGIVTRNWMLPPVIFVGGLLAPKLILSYWKQVRSAKFETQLMDGLLIIGNSLKSGLDIVAGLERVATTMKAPISEEIGLVVNAYRLGTPLEAALMDLTTRINSRTLETAIYAINIQRETGGNIIKTFDQLIMTIREEEKLQKKVRALTSQATTQIFFLAGFPWALGLIFYFTAPDFMAPALANRWGQIVLVFLVIWEAIGIVITKKLVLVEV